MQWSSWLQFLPVLPAQLFNGLCAPVVFSGRSNSLAPMAQVVLWFLAPVVSGRGNSLVPWLHGFPWFPAADWFLWLDWCGVVAQVRSVWSSGSGFMDISTPFFCV